MSEPKRLTPDELVEISKPIPVHASHRYRNILRAFREREALLAHVAALEAETAELKAANKEAWSDGYDCCRLANE